MKNVAKLENIISSKISLRKTRISNTLWSYPTSIKNGTGMNILTARRTTIARVVRESLNCWK